MYAASADGRFVMQGYLFQDSRQHLTEKTERMGVAKLINAAFN